MIFLKDDYF